MYSLSAFFARDLVSGTISRNSGIDHDKVKPAIFESHYSWSDLEKDKHKDTGTKQICIVLVVSKSQSYLSLVLSFPAELRKLSKL